MPCGLIRKGTFNRRAASATNGVESLAKERDSDSAVMLRSCAVWPCLQKEQTSRTSGFQDCTPVADSCHMLEWEGMKQLIALVLVLSVIASSASANLGANSEQIEDAYGTIVQRRLRDDGTVSVVYTKGRYLYMVTVANSRSISESYSRANGKDLSEKEITQFLKGNSGAKWVASTVGTERHFRTSDGAAEATYGILNGRPALTVRDLRR